MKLRAHRRLPTRFSTVADCPSGARRDIVIVDITEFGAKIDGLGMLEPGSPCRIHVMSTTIGGVVRWSGGGSAGVAFEQKLTAQQLDIIRHRRTPRLSKPHAQSSGHGFKELR